MKDPFFRIVEDLKALIAPETMKGIDTDDERRVFVNSNEGGRYAVSFNPLAVEKL